MFLGRALLEWLVLFLPAAALGLFTILVAGQASSIRRLASWLRTDRLSAVAERHFTSVYALTVVSLFACAALVPCQVFFKYAYDAVSEIALKDDQVVLSQNLLARRDRIRSYYETLHAPEIARRRLVDTRDRYDTAWYRTNCDPTLDQALGDSCTNLPELPADCGPVNPPSTGKTWNDWIERQMARATLTFPSNETGSATSGLGVASTDDTASWERSWLELTPRFFLLRWKPASRMPGFGVAASYPSWHGLNGPATGCLAAVLAGFVFWLVRISRQTFLTEVVSAPKFETVDWKNVSEITRNSLVIGRAQSGKSKRLKALSGLNPAAWRDLRTEVLNRTKSPDLQASACRECVMILHHFEFNIRDRVCNLARLELLETLLYEVRCKLVIISTVDPLYTPDTPMTLGGWKQQLRLMYGMRALGLCPATLLYQIFCSRQITIKVGGSGSGPLSFQIGVAGASTLSKPELGGAGLVIGSDSGEPYRLLSFAG